MNNRTIIDGIADPDLRRRSGYVPDFRQNRPLLLHGNCHDYSQYGSPADGGRLRYGADPGQHLFAATFLITDILSETAGKKAAQKAVNIGIATSVAFILISQSWLLYTPAASDWARESFETIFTNTPRLMIVSFLVYAICQRFDVWAYHKWWAFTTKRCGDGKRFLWLRNNGSTMISQILNTVLYTFGAFFSMYDLSTLISICVSSYVIFLVTSLADTPVIYLARRIKKRKIFLT